MTMWPEISGPGCDGMKILAVADKETDALWNWRGNQKQYEGVDLILSCGDLKPEYLEFLVSMANCPLLYVRGNHDDHYRERPPEGCLDIDGRVADYRGLRIMGLGGSMRYRKGINMYGEDEMRARAERLNRSVRVRRGVDLFVSHAPAAGYGDQPDLPHRGFSCFDDLLWKHRPAYMLHGHVHPSYGKWKKEYEHPGGTRILNAYGALWLEIGEDEYPARGKTGSLLYDWYTSFAGEDAIL